MGQATRTTKLLLDLGRRDQGGANSQKRAALDATAEVLTAARAFYIDFFLAHAGKLAERVIYYSEEHLELRERLISAHELLSWAESCTVETAAHPHPWTGWNFTQRFPGMPFAYRRSVIKDAIGKVRSYLSNHANWEKSGKQKGKPGWPAATDHPTLYQGCIQLQLEALELKAAFVRINVYTAEGWRWMHYPVNSNHYSVERLKETDWRRQSPTLVLRAHSAELHVPQVKKIAASKVMERKQDPDLVTVGVDLNVKNLALITVRQHGRIIKTVFVTDHGLDAHRYRHLKKIAKKQWQSGQPVKGEHSNQQLWRHVDRLNADAAHKVARRIAQVCANYPGCILLFERLRKIKPGKGSKSRRMNRRRANQLRGKINQQAKDKAYLQQVVSVEVNAHFNHADLSDADLSGAGLRAADLSDANLCGTNLSGADLRNAEISRAKVGWTQFDNVDLRTVKGLEAVEHRDPSTIGIDTIYRSAGHIPEIFLRRAGVPEDFIISMRSLMTHPVEYSTCFISYASQDQDFAERLSADLQSNGVRCWFAPEDWKIGENFWHSFDESIRLYDKLLIVLSEHSVNSQWVEREVMAALEKEQQQNKLVLFPITLDKLVKQTHLPWAVDIRRTRHMGDFSRWKDQDAYQQAFKRLLLDLQSHDQPKRRTEQDEP